MQYMKRNYQKSVIWIVKSETVLKYLNLTPPPQKKSCQTNTFIYAKFFFIYNTRNFPVFFFCLFMSFIQFTELTQVNFVYHLFDILNSPYIMSSYQQYICLLIVSSTALKLLNRTTKIVGYLWFKLILK